MDGKCITVDQASIIFKQVMDEMMTFDDEEDKLEYLLDAVKLYKEKSKEIKL